MLKICAKALRLTVKQGLKYFISKILNGKCNLEERNSQTAVFFPKEMPQLNQVVSST